MKFFQHPNIVTTDVELESAPDGTISYILAIGTDLPLSDADGPYDVDAVSSLVKAAQAYLRESGFHRARITQIKAKEA